MVFNLNNLMEKKSFSSRTLTSEIKHVVFTDWDLEEKTHDNFMRILLLFKDFQMFEAENRNQLTFSQKVL